MAKAAPPASVKSLAVGLHKGFVVTKPKSKRKRPAARKARTSNRVREIRKLIRTVVGLTPFEKKFFEMMKSGVEKVESRAFRLAKRRMGTKKRALSKQKEIQNIIKNAAKKDH